MKNKRRKTPAPNENLDLFKQEKKGRKKGIAVSAVSMLSFFGILIGFAAMSIFGEKRTFSELENRNLEKFPKFTTEKFFSGDYMDDIEVYTADHFFGRDVFVKFKTMCDLAVGKKERNDVYILNDRLVQRFDPPDEKITAKSIDAINKFAEETDIPVFMMLVPTAGEIYSDDLPANAPMASEKEFIDSVYRKLSDRISVLDAYTTMKLNQSEYIYYRNDHHWTTHGAYLAYYTAGRKMGYTPFEMSSCDIEHASSEFKGSLYSHALYDGIDADTVDYYHCHGGAVFTGEYVYNSPSGEPEFYSEIYHREYLEKKDKYLSFTGANAPVVTFTSENSGGRLLIFKDSYANCYVPLLMQNYSKVTMIDLRYVQISWKDFPDTDLSEYDQVLFLYNALTFSTDRNIPNIGF